MHCSKKSLSWVSVATIALFASLSQNSIAASNVDSGISSTSSRPLLEANPYVKPPIINLANLAPDLKSKFDRLKATNPYMYDQVINVANYGALENDVLKGIKNPRDRMGFSRAVRAANPNYNLASATAAETHRKAQAKIMKDLDNPKTELGQIPMVASLMRQADDLNNSIQALPDSGSPILNRFIVSPISRLWNPQPYYTAEAKRHQYAEAFQRVRGISWQDIEAVLPLDSGRMVPTSVIHYYENSFVGQLISDINQAHEAAGGNGGVPVARMPPETFKYLKDQGYVDSKVDSKGNHYIIPTITYQKYVDLLKGRNQ